MAELKQPWAQGSSLSASGEQSLPELPAIVTATHVVEATLGTPLEGLLSMGDDVIGPGTDDDVPVLVVTTTAASLVVVAITGAAEAVAVAMHEQMAWPALRPDSSTGMSLLQAAIAQGWAVLAMAADEAGLH